MSEKKELPFVSIITRAYQRLEYTIHCVNSVNDHTIYPNYEHLVVNNACTDGTKEWLDWTVKYNSKWFPNLRLIHLKENSGDFGGLREGAKHVDKRCQYIVQLDNDIEVESKWLSKLVNIIAHIPEKIVQALRIGVRDKIKIQNPRKVKLSTGLFTIGKIARPVGCFIVGLSDFRKALHYIDTNGKTYKDKSRESKCLLSKFLKGTIKVEEVRCHMIDGFEAKNKVYVNYTKYPMTIVHPKY